MGISDEYVAGFFDGEGSCFVSEYRSKGKTYFKPVAKITQVNREVLDLIVEHYGFGNVVSKSDKRAIENGWQACHEVVFANRSARRLLVAIEPHLIVKRQVVSDLLDRVGRDLEDRRKRAPIV